MNKILGFAVNSHNYGLELDFVERIMLSNEISSIPESPAYFEGVMKYQDQVISVMNLCKRLKLDGGELKKFTIIVVKVGENIFGLLVSEIKGIIELDVANFQMSDKKINRFESKLVKGYIKAGEKIITILDVEELFDHKEVDKNE